MINSRHRFARWIIASARPASDGIPQKFHFAPRGNIEYKGHVTKTPVEVGEDGGRCYEGGKIYYFLFIVVITRILAVITQKKKVVMIAKTKNKANTKKNSQELE